MKLAKKIIRIVVSVLFLASAVLALLSLVNGVTAIVSNLEETLKNPDLLSLLGLAVTAVKVPVYLLAGVLGLLGKKPIFRRFLAILIIALTVVPVVLGGNLAIWSMIPAILLPVLYIIF